MKLYIGTYTQDLLTGLSTGSKGIYVCEFDDVSGMLMAQCTAGNSENPSFLRLSSDGSMLLAANELLGTGALDLYAVGEDGGLKHKDKVRFTGNACCYASIAEDRSFAAGVHYGEGEVFAYRLDGLRFAERTFSFTGKGSGPVKERQEGPHAHSIRLVNATNTAIVCDLGCDSVYFFSYASGGNMTLQSTLRTAPGCGPRHTELSGDLERLYISCELSNEVLYYRRGCDGYRFEQRISTLPAGYSGANTAADIHFSLDERRLYVSNRGHDSIVTYAVGGDGRLSVIGFASCGGKAPRNIAVFQNHVLCANQDSGNVTVLRLTDDGAADGVVCELPIPAAVCVEKTR